jgi:outer membrane immunogenic protein
MRGFLLVAIMVGAVTGAQAADLPDLPILRGGFSEGLGRPVTNWQGIYVGGQVSYGSVTSKVPGGLNADMQGTFFPPAGLSYNWQPLGNAHDINTGYGAFAGYNWQWDDVILGVEGNYIHDGFRSSTTATGFTFQSDNVTVATQTNSVATVKLSDFGSLRLRAGYAIGCFLPYAFVGAGFGSQTVDRAISANPPPIRPGWATDSSSKLIYGYSAGFGVDTQLIGGLFARAEYEYRRITSNIESNVHSARVGLGYRF